MAIGPIGVHHANKHDHLTRLDIEMDLSIEGLWFVYHKDLKNSARIQALYEFLDKSLN
jgi:DNA-binding transcriptional LysR family regulator